MCHQEHNTPLPFERLPPVSFKRLLGGARLVEKWQCSDLNQTTLKEMEGDIVLKTALSFRDHIHEHSGVAPSQGPPRKPEAFLCLIGRH